MKTLIVVIAVLFLAVVSVSLAQDEMNKQMEKKHEKSTEMKSMHETATPTAYVITIKHTPDQCLKAMDDIAKNDPQLLKETYFGCRFGDHTSYTIVHAKNEEQAKNMIPEDLRADATVNPVEKLTKNQIKELHKTAENEKRM